MNTRMRISGLATALVAAASAPVLAQRPATSLLSQLEPGSWELRDRDGGSVERICLPDDRRLIQLRHPSEVCDRLVVNDTASELVVQYTCRGRGYGRTHIRRETNQLVQIDTQGIADGLPFAFAAEARKVGRCKS